MHARDQTLVALAAILLLELVLLRRGQRRLFWATANATHSRLLAYALAAPGTVLHEASHYLACVALGVPVLGRVRLFWPRRTPEGGVVLGSVPHAQTDPLRQGLISIAPLILMPGFLAVATALLLAPDALPELPDALGRVPAWRAVLCAYISLSCAQAVFPSPGDRVGALGLLCLAIIGAGAVLTALALAGHAGLRDLLGTAVGVLALPALGAVASLLVLALLGRATRPTF